MQLYVHVPFCKSRCRYCAFHSSAMGPRSLPEDFADAVLCEARLRAEELELTARETRTQTIFFGGGTPSLLAPAVIAQIIEGLDAIYPVEPDAEISMEANPDSLLRPHAAEGFRRAGVNRISIGVQSLNDAELAMLGRIHTAEDALAAIACAGDAGFSNVGIDLMWGLPGQTAEGWLATLGRAAAAGPVHISAYALTLEEGTPLAALACAGRLALPPDEETAAMYEQGTALLAARGFRHYEISNYARQGMECRHNLGYWRQSDYLGFGPSAVSTVKGARQTDVADYARWTQSLRLGSPIRETEELGLRERMLETIILRLRTADGLGPEDLASDFPPQLFARVQGELAPSIKAGLAECTGNGGTLRIRLTDRGMLVSNAILERVFDCAERCLS